MTDWTERQLAACRYFGVAPMPVAADEIVGIAREVRSGLRPLCGVRHLPEHGTSGWYIWAGEKSDAADFFVPIHASHVEEWCADALRFLQLPAGWCFMVEADGQYDAWFDPAIDLTPLPNQ